ncbi:MAG: DMT family transporter [Burkholderiales bacterium]
MSDHRRALDATAFSVMVLLTAAWGFQQVMIKLAAVDVSLVMQAAIRSISATILLLVWVRLRSVTLVSRDGTLRPGLVAGLLFSAEFVLIYAGLGHTTASRMIVFIYLTPPLTALGLHWLVPGERMQLRQWLGVFVSFAGIVLAFGEGFAASGGATMLGDLCGVIAAVLWAATTVLIRASALARVSATKRCSISLRCRPCSCCWRPG